MWMNLQCDWVKCWITISALLYIVFKDQLYLRKKINCLSLLCYFGMHLCDQIISIDVAEFRFRISKSKLVACQISDTTSYFLFPSREAVGVLLADFVIRVHQMFASKGTFSPRLFSFLGIDFEKVQSEEVSEVFATIFIRFSNVFCNFHFYLLSFIVLQLYILYWQEYFVFTFNFIICYDCSIELIAITGIFILFSLRFHVIELSHFWYYRRVQYWRY